jgi:hypothetical protein
MESADCQDAKTKGLHFERQDCCGAEAERDAQEINDGQGARTVGVLLLSRSFIVSRQK